MTASTAPTWARFYPDLGTVMRAPLQTLVTWDQHLPAPQTDVERTIRRRMKGRICKLLADEMTRQHPELVDELSRVVGKFEESLNRVLGNGRGA